MGFFDWLFGKKESRTLQLEDVQGFLQKEKEKSTLLEREVPELFAEIKHCIKEIGESVKKLEGSESEVKDSRFLKVAQTSRAGFINRVSTLLQKLEPPFGADEKQVKEYCHQAKKALDREIFASRKNITYTSMAMPESMREIGKNFQSINDSLEKMQTLVNENPIVFSSEIETYVNQIKEKKDFLRKIRLRKKDLDSELKELEKNVSIKRKEMEKLEASSEAKKLTEIEERIKKLIEKKEKIKASTVEELLSLSRLLKKLRNAAEKEQIGFSQEKHLFLDKMVSEPARAIKEDLKGERIKEIISDLKKAVSEKAIQLKEKEAEKSTQTMKKILEKDFFNEIFWPSNNTEAEIKKLEKKAGEMKIRESVRQAKLELKGLERNLSEKKEEAEKAKETISKTKKEIQDLIEKLEKTLTKVLGKKTIIKTGERKAVQARIPEGNDATEATPRLHQ